MIRERTVEHDCLLVEVAIIVEQDVNERARRPVLVLLFEKNSRRACRRPDAVSQLVVDHEVLEVIAGAREQVHVEVADDEEWLSRVKVVEKTLQVEYEVLV